MTSCRMSPAEGLGSVAVLAALVALWWVTSHGGWVSRVFLPTTEATLENLRDGLFGGQLWAFTLATIGHMVEGCLLASAVGVALGAMIGISPTARAYLQPRLEFVRPLPASTLLPLAISVSGLNPAMVLAAVAFGAMWTVLLATVRGFANVEPACSKWRAACSSAAPPSSGKSACRTHCPTSWPACGCRSRCR